MGAGLTLRALVKWVYKTKNKCNKIELSPKSYAQIRPIFQAEAGIMKKPPTEIQSAVWQDAYFFGRVTPCRLQNRESIRDKLSGLNATDKVTPCSLSRRPDG
ncbi:hypothetical protein GCM10007390_09660 [Persicitalea jodogahamensis]|uniref:Uncharacterized protein n=1 Tax=Persicitalea jodogahamensis TaxID=402147 RepID=A0A8J3D2F7_9BACT|nr:hypothetical protein GCM10007390_09660 [Persicitalea jodogahamensis]